MDNQWLSDRDALDWKQNKVGSATVSKYDYGVNAIGQRDSVAATSTVGTFATAPDWNWLYNPRGELVSSQHVNTSASSRHYTFDGIGNRSEHRDGTHTATGGTAKAYTPNALNQYDAVGTLSPTYDLDGNMTSGPIPFVPAANSALLWDGENQLIQVTPSGGTAIQFHYDGLGRRFASTEGSERTYRFYDGWNLVAQFTGDVHTSGTAPTVTLKKTWLWGTDLSGSLQGAGGVGGLLAACQEHGSNTGVYQPLYDGNGNIGQYLDGSGTVVAKYEYDGFGKSLVSTGSHSSVFPHRFSTKPLDSETGLYYYAYRYYDPATGRWPSRDPIEEEGGLNLYGFIGNDGIGVFDVLGLQQGGACTITIRFAHGDSVDPTSGIDLKSENSCNPTLEVGCAANFRNTFRIANGIGVPLVIPYRYPWNDQRYPKIREGMKVDPNTDSLQEDEVLERIKEAVAAANGYAPQLCTRCCCKSVKIVVKPERSAIQSLKESFLDPNEPELKETLTLLEYAKTINCN